MYASNAIRISLSIYTHTYYNMSVYVCVYIYICTHVYISLSLYI